MGLRSHRFQENADEFFAEFASSFSRDRRLLPYELTANRAWAFALARAGVLTSPEARSIARGLRAIRKRAEQDPSWLANLRQEDVHTFVEAQLFESIGEPALRLHTGRSRNDQVALDLRMYVKDACRGILLSLRELGFELCRFAEAHPGTVIPGYTHMRKTPPVLLSHFLLAYVQMLLRDAERLEQTAQRANVLPLGSGALAGASYPVDRERLARRLGFADVTDNSLDAVSDRDFLVDLLAACALLGVHLSRVAEDLILYSSAEFGFLELSDEVSSVPSIMPLKKNPDSLELVRGKSGRLIGNLTGLLTVLKALPMAYNRDLQEDKVPLFDTVDTTQQCLRILRAVIAGLHVHEDRCRSAAMADFAAAPDLADYLVRKGVPFRTAHRLVAKVVIACVETGNTFESLPMETYRDISEQFEEDLLRAVTVEESLNARSVRGGTAPVVVAVALKRAQKKLRKLGNQTR